MIIDVEYNWDHQSGIEHTIETKYKERVVNQIRENLAGIKHTNGTIFLCFFKKRAQEWGVKVRTEGFTIDVEVKILIRIDIIVHPFTIGHNSLVKYWKHFCFIL